MTAKGAKKRPAHPDHYIEDEGEFDMTEGQRIPIYRKEEVASITVSRDGHHSIEALVLETLAGVVEEDMRQKVKDLGVERDEDGEPKPVWHDGSFEFKHGPHWVKVQTGGFADKDD